MVDTINDDWMAEFRRRDVKPIVLFDVEARKSSDGTLETFKWCTGSQTFSGYDPCVEMPTAFGAELDPITREISIEEIEIVIPRQAGSGTLRDLLDTHFLKGKKVTVKLGTANLAAGKFIQLGVYVADRLRPSPAALTLTLSSAGLAMLRDTPFKQMTWVSRHPLEAIKMIFQGATSVDIPSAVWDSPAGGSFDPSVAANDVISNYVTTRTFSTRSGQSEPPVSSDEAPGSLILSIVEMLQGTMYPRASTGELRFKLYDSGKAVDRTWDVDERDIVAPEDVWADAIDEVSIRVAPDLEEDFWRFTGVNLTAQTDLGYGSSKIKHRHEVSCPWMGGVGDLETTISSADAAGATFDVRHAQANGMTGTGTDNSSWPVHSARPAWTLLSATKTAYLLFINGDPVNGGDIEIIEVDDAVEVTPALFYDMPQEQMAFGYRQSRGCYPIYRFRIKTRDAIPAYNAAGTTVVSGKKTWPGSNFTQGTIRRCVDITPAVRWVRAILERASYGLPKVEVRTWLDQMDVEIGDMVLPIAAGLPTSMVPVRPGGTDQKWEVVGKSIALRGDQPGIRWKLAFVREAAVLSWTASVVVAPPIAVAIYLETVVDSSGSRVTSTGGGGADGRTGVSARRVK